MINLTKQLRSTIYTILSVALIGTIYVYLGPRIAVGFSASIGTLYLVIALLPFDILSRIGRIRESKLGDSLKYLADKSNVFLLTSLVCFVAHALLATFIILRIRWDYLGRLDVFPGLLSLIILTTVSIFLIPKLQELSGKFYNYIRQSVYVILPLALTHSQLSKGNFSDTLSLVGLLGFGLIIVVFFFQIFLNFLTSFLQIFYIVIGLLMSVLIIVFAANDTSINLPILSERVQGVSERKSEFVETYIDQPESRSRSQENQALFSQVSGISLQESNSIPSNQEVKSAATAQQIPVNKQSSTAASQVGQSQESASSQAQSIASFSSSIEVQE